MKWLKRVGWLVLALAIIAAGLGLWKREDITRLMAVNSLFAEDKIVDNFSHMNAAFLTREVPRGDGPVSALPKGTDTPLPHGAQTWIEDRAVTSLLVLKTARSPMKATTSARARKICASAGRSPKAICRCCSAF